MTRDELRAFFAGCALTGLISRYGNEGVADGAKKAFDFADTMLAEHDDRPTPSRREPATLTRVAKRRPSPYDLSTMSAFTKRGRKP